jgi:hypothetical protein
MHSKFVPLLASAWLLAFSLQNSSAIPIIYTLGAGSSVSANRSEPSLGINIALMTSLSGTSFTLDETGQSSIRPAERFRADRQGGMALSYGQSFSFSPSRAWTNEPLLDAKNFVPRDITATLDFSNPGTRTGSTGSASDGDGGSDRTVSIEQISFARELPWYRQGVLDRDSPAPPFVLPDPTIMIELALNAEAPPKDKENGTDPVIEVSKNQEGYSAPVSSVPENGSTALLLGTAILALGLARRRFATR